jgi:hypothetical protein
MNQVVTAEMFDAFLSIKNKYVHDEESFRQFYFYMSDFNQMVRIDMDDTATRLKLKDHYKAAAERLGENRQTIWRATKMKDEITL